MKQKLQFLLVTLAFSLLQPCLARENAKYAIDGRVWSYVVRQGDATITGVEPKTGHVKIPPKLGKDDFPVTAIGRWVFKGGKGIVNVEIPDSVESIGDEAFAGCENMMSVDIPNSVTVIERAAFYGCKGLKSVTIPDSVTHIGDNAFLGCNGLTKASIPETFEDHKEAILKGVRVFR